MAKRPKLPRAPTDVVFGGQVTAPGAKNVPVPRLLNKPSPPSHAPRRVDAPCQADPQVGDPTESESRG